MIALYSMVHRVMDKVVQQFYQMSQLSTGHRVFYPLDQSLPLQHVQYQAQHIGQGVCSTQSEIAGQRRKKVVVLMQLYHEKVAKLMEV